MVSEGEQTDTSQKLSVAVKQLYWFYGHQTDSESDLRFHTSAAKSWLNKVPHS